MPAAPEPLLTTIAPYPEDVVVCVEWTLHLGPGRLISGRKRGFPACWGHALSMKAIHGGNAKHDKIDSPKIAALLRGGRLPQAYAYPAAMRATRDLLRRRMHLARKRAELLAHVQHTNRQDHLPAIGNKMAYTANRDGGAERLADPAVHTSIEVDLALIGYDDERLRDVELTLLKTAKHPDANTLSLVQTVPGIGKSLSLVWRDEIHDINRFPTGQDVVSHCRLVKCAKESAGKRWGTAGTKIGNAYLKWAFSEAAGLFLRNNPAGQKYRARLVKQQGQGKAFTVLAHQLARAVYDMLKRDTAFDMDTFFNE